ncbi:3-dehydroquinate synthase [Marinihelvus fidelis]|uniref:3-dehydroquinate synthase n=1 Tax=Marinihelvus fidelis TaxID=2613842 RepID=A0A5N0T3A7_9GAMM|nr:3-dehydroquinate synthase [Marinihelvus fidelis]KAA9129560.1 3-dehydroquinate synthase [Marinihelvus fidelis]
MRTIDIPLGDRSYPVRIGEGLLADPAAWAPHVGQAPILIVTNETVAPLYLPAVLGALKGHDVDTFTMADGEAEKNWDNWRALIGRLADRHAPRDTTLVALGGGVVGDLCGFAAATWMRGIRFIQAPTTLLAQVDASVGGKTAINIPQGKNLVGAFHQPAAVIADTATLRTLPPREYRAGLAEVLKYGAICDAGFIDWIEANIDALRAMEPDALAEIVERSVRYKAEVVGADEREQGVRAILNFGHTFGHALETHTGYQRYLHGEAVAIGMVVAATLSESRGLLAPGLARRLADIQSALGLPVTVPADIDAPDLLQHMKLDKKNLAGRRRLVLLSAPGKAIVDEDSADADILAALNACRAEDPAA